MEVNKQQLTEIIILSTQKVISETNAADPATVIFNTPLYGKGGVLDSLGLVQLIADVEEEIYQQTGNQITIADEKAMSMRISPFRSVSSLSDYIYSIL
ncbi:MAG: hypothetical protein FD170_2390 [Bacteroidetes bacterium]|nr:MAG: hypothetical protein FD170_2390 [Bacteroidota bacterium]